MKNKLILLLFILFTNSIYANESYFKPAIGDVEIGLRANATASATGNEVVVSSYDGRLIIWKNDRTLLSDEWPITFSDGYVATSPYLYDTDNNGEMEIAVVVENSAGNNYLHIVDKTGSDITGFPIELIDGIDKIDVISTPVIAEMDNNTGNGFEILISSADGVDGKLYIFHQDGTIAPNWPVAIIGGKGYPIAGDLTGDVKYEIIVSIDNGKVRSFNYDSTEIFGLEKD